MEKKKKTSNGLQTLPPNVQAIRDQVMLDELKARHWKAQYDTAYYHLEFEKILPEYQKLLERLEQERKDVAEKQKELVEQLKKSMEDGTIPNDVVIEEKLD